ncbi:MAG: bifunctional transaldolase/phosoglucose isomerase [Chloroflexota bacterium]|nr:bifunctional transaldolase/phosoglucose isomerase [Chloroflexota bacterium]
MTNAIQQSRDLGQAIWLDYIRRGLFTSGELQQFIDQGISGVTSNPTIFEKAIVGSTDYDDVLLASARSAEGVLQTYEALATEDIRTAADLLRPIYDSTDGLHGYVSLEVSPLLAYNTEATIEEAKRLFAALNRPNVMIKVPATREGMPAVRSLISQGINVNVTLIFSLHSYQQVMEAYIAGLEELVGRGGDPGRVASVASFFLSRVDTSVDSLLDERIRGGQMELRALQGRAAIANARLAYRAFKETFDSERFTALAMKGAKVQRPLWASTGVKNPAYSDLLYVEPLIGPDTVNTMPPATIAAFLEHGHAETTLETGVAEAKQALSALATAGINMDSVTEKLLAEGVKSFADSFEKLLTGIVAKRARLLAKEHVHKGVSLGKHLPDVEAALADLEYRDVIGRIWRKDYTVWKPEPVEITNRLGWLTVSDMMREQIPALESFAQEICDEGFRKVVLLGMGGSSLGPEVLMRTFRSAKGYPELVVLDSTVPSRVQSVSESIDPSRTLFIVSSKSGTTTEPDILLRYFKSMVETAVGKERGGQHFVAITDPGTPLASMAEDGGFRRVFINPSDIGGRYSVLSYFGLVLAALIGVDITELLERADTLREGCASCAPVHENPGAWLGATMGTLALQGRNKLTLVTSPGMSGFGLWVEQLIAESTGKEGKGVIPVDGEPLVEPLNYGDDRLFVYVRLDGDDNGATDAAVEGIKAAGQPVLVLEMRDRYDLGAEFFRWEFATAVAGAILGINPFDQPDVQAAKDATQRVVQEYLASGHLPQVDALMSPVGLLNEAKKGDYLAIMAYIRETTEVDAVIAELRRNVVQRYAIATTFGYGPRFLHSTGQLHKGGPDSGLFLQITTNHENNLPIPGEPYTFGVVADAQALGDLQALQSLGRRVARIHLEHVDQSTLDKLSHLLLNN